jgi:hypothetical protein
LATTLLRSKGKKQVSWSFSLGKPPKSPKPSFLQNHHYKTNMGTELTTLIRTKNSFILIRVPSFDE